ncbi:hypothetical protein P167DRAFT_533227 [Morchella conica CCBAS932]|uniref:Ubiquitin 3 binding protein But2 C-terminal domain-containing protein n=1 Tax=Morchella conica CCBAS932 TaxID=1392247 RepID=A0A3N4KXY4_9PEZI|nr:hypothetical protein P167DRAFT_533227 [Morchella conica CCBAS932]
MIGWDIPAGGPKNCIIKLELSQEPGQPQNTWKATGGGRMNVYILSDSPPINYRTISWDNRPARSPPVPQWSVAQPISGGKAAITGASIPCPEGRLFVELTSDEQSLLYLKWFELTQPRNGITLEMSNS